MNTTAARKIKNNKIEFHTLNMEITNTFLFNTWRQGKMIEITASFKKRYALTKKKTIPFSLNNQNR